MKELAKSELFLFLMRHRGLLRIRGAFLGRHSFRAIRPHPVQSIADIVLMRPYDSSLFHFGLKQISFNDLITRTCHFKMKIQVRIYVI